MEERDETKVTSLQTASQRSRRCGGEGCGCGDPGPEAVSVHPPPAMDQVFFWALGTSQEDPLPSGSLHSSLGAGAGGREEGMNYTGMNHRAGRAQRRPLRREVGKGQGQGEREQ